MIFDFDLTDASERRISAYNALGSINSSLIVSASCRAVRRSCVRPPGGRLLAFLFFILFMQHTQHTLLFFVQSYKSKKF